ncbi:DUF7115 domain-containing protein [Halorubrum laminariae]|uniref:DUF7115 domain-containing protein n=1 Tax=Halorubrum laminariae TaxID=1433523 RepID=A0ABD6BWF4_9EURY|nr:hypothetical protein [Halorubrum laminariae]
MSLPDLLAEAIGDENVVAEVSLGGADRLAVTPTRTLVYRSDGLLSDESVAEHSHDVERLAVSAGRRKAKLTLSHGLDGDETISVPAKRVDDVLHPILAGILSATGVTDPGESVVRTFRFSELTLVVTSDRLVKHVGSVVWDQEFEEFPYADLTDLDFEEGTVATAVVLALDNRSERFKAPNESARAVRETLVDAVCSFYDVDSLGEFRATVAADADDADGSEAESTTDFGEGPDPLSASPVADAEAESDAVSAEPGVDASDEAVRGIREADSGAAGDAATEPETDPTADTADARAAESPTEPASTATDQSTASGHAATDDPTAETHRAGNAAAGSADPSATGTSTETDVLDEPVSDASGDGPIDADAFDGSPFESAGLEGEDLATEVAALRREVETQSERLERQSALIEQLIEELRRGR